MDSQVKQRITGAVVLVVLIVIFVPALLTGPRRPAPAQVAPPALPGEPALQSYRSDLRASPTQVAPPGGQENQQANADDAVAQVTAAEPDQKPAAGPSISAPSGQKPASGEDQPSAAHRATVPKASSAPKPTAPKVSDRPKSVAASAGSWAVQIGGFSNRANGEKLVGELRRQGFQAFVSETSSGKRPLFRVRVGPARDKAAAEALLKRVRSAGHSGSIVAIP